MPGEPAGAGEPARTRAIVLDIEGTTTPIEFVREVLFPFARRHVEEFLARHGDDPAVSAAVDRLRAERLSQRAASAPGQPIAAYVRELIDQDSKSTGLKSLQGLIWRAGYRSGELRAIVYPDVPAALERWVAQECRVAIFSSGSVLAQQDLFAHTDHGDLTSWITAWFDTTTGPKNEPLSYRLIAESLALPPTDVLFISDVLAELDAARAARMLTLWCLRSDGGDHTECDGSAGTSASPGIHPIVHDLDSVLTRAEPGS